MPSRLLCLALVSFLAPACSLARSVTPTNGAPDVATLDGGGLDLGGHDAGDAHTPDLGIADAGPDMFVQPVDMGPDMFVPPVDMGPDMFVPPVDMGTDMFVPPVDMGTDMFVAPVDMGTDMFVPPVDMGTDVFTPPVDMGTDMFVAPIDMGTDAFTPPDMGTDGGPCAACTGTQTCCSLMCVDTTNDVNNCGTCGHTCHGMQMCVSSRCVGWAPIAATGAPSGRSQHTAVWTGSVMIVWGGTNATGELNTGGVYDPATDTWTTTTMTNVPTGRRGHAGVWTGSRMVIWGGYSGTAWLNDAASYDPVGDTWTTLPMAGAPSARSRFAYAWDSTQSELIVLGGWTGTGGPPGFTPMLANDASRFDLATWQATSGTGLSARYYLSAYMTGTGAATRFLTWGGEVANGGTLQSGARYDPATNMWSNMGTTNRPTSRSRYMGVSTGTTMIVWGGWSGTAVRADGGLYDPTADTWTTLGSTTLAARSVATAVWTGTEMVVFGGADDPTYGTGVAFFNDAAAYATSGNAWRAVSGTNAPGARSDHTAVWTGTEMIVWGGRNATMDLADGARITP